MKNILYCFIEGRTHLACQEVLKWVWLAMTQKGLLSIQIQTVPPRIQPIPDQRSCWVRALSYFTSSFLCWIDSIFICFEMQFVLSFIMVSCDGVGIGGWHALCEWGIDKVPGRVTGAVCNMLRPQHNGVPPPCHLGRETWLSCLHRYLTYLKGGALNLKP